jgi:hypothetical protein
MTGDGVVGMVDDDMIEIGYEISFTRYFYQPPPMRSLDEIRADILALEKETDGLLTEIIGAGIYAMCTRCFSVALNPTYCMMGGNVE